MRISGSIFAVKDHYLDYARQLQYSNADYLHIDIFDDKESDFSLQDVLQFDKTFLPLDIHLICHKIERSDIEILNRSNTQFFNIQYETLTDKEDVFYVSKHFKGNFGISITDATELEILDKYIDCISQVLFMCSEPGVSGARFSSSNFDRIRTVRNKFPNLQVFVDGGINDKIAEEMNRLGVSMVVSGSYLSAATVDLGKRVYMLRYANELDIKVSRNMIKTINLPLIDHTASFMDIITRMNQYRLGIVFVTDENEFIGVISDGDIRRGYLKYGKDIFDNDASALMNRNPFVVDRQMTMDELFSVLEQNRKGISIVPVIENGKLIGAIDLHMGV